MRTILFTDKGDRLLVGLVRRWLNYRKGDVARDKRNGSRLCTFHQILI